MRNHGICGGQWSSACKVSLYLDAACIDAHAIQCMKDLFNISDNAILLLGVDTLSRSAKTELSYFL